MHCEGEQGSPESEPVSQLTFPLGMADADPDRARARASRTGREEGSSSRQGGRTRCALLLQAACSTSHASSHPSGTGSSLLESKVQQ